MSQTLVMSSSVSLLAAIVIEWLDSFDWVCACLAEHFGSKGECSRSIGLESKTPLRLTSGSSFLFSLAHDVHFGGVVPFLGQV